MYILETKELTKHFGSHCALDHVSLRMQPGAVYGLLGPNGAGKTTLLRIINNILVKDSGEVLFKGTPIDYEMRRYLGYMPEERGLYPKMTVEEQILFFAQLHGAERKQLIPVMKEYLDLFSIPDSDRKRQVKELSKGNQQKVQIICTLAHEPELVMLDEPFSGFDPINGALLSQLIERLKERGTTIVLSSHNMAAVEEICTDIALINHGQLMLNGRISDIKKQYRDNIFEITTVTPVDYTQLQENVPLEILAHTVVDDGDAYRYQLRPLQPGMNNELIRYTCDHSTMLEFREVLPSLSDLFIRVTSGEIAHHSPEQDFERL